ncbi:NfeD family protein [Moraxella nonliquefaciens]|uniref:NfeD family protein n=1 Tax=Moraxella nonliquefaciens TaxID=478 RepID=UPI003EE241A2
MNVYPWHWLIFGLILMILEMFVPTFFLLWFGASAVVTAVLAWAFGFGFGTEVILWLVLSVILCLSWFKFIQPNIKTRTTAGLGGSVIIGEIGMLPTPQVRTDLAKFGLACQRLALMNGCAVGQMARCCRRAIGSWWCRYSVMSWWFGVSDTDLLGLIY